MKHSLIVTLAGLLCLARFAAAQEPAIAEKTGLKIGAPAPTFKLRDQTGKPRTLAEIGKNADYVALVFYRSANW